MTALLRSPRYRFTDSLAKETAEADHPRAQRFEDGQALNEQLVLTRLGVRGWGRWRYFRMGFSGAWGEGHENPLSPRSQIAFLRALEHLRFPDRKPSLFLTDEGHLELAWRDQSGAPIQLEFGPRETEIYIESAGVEVTIQNEDLPKAIGRYFND